MKRILNTVIVLLTALSAMGQVHVEAKIDSMVIYIGQQAHLTLDVTCKQGQQVEFPVYERAQMLVPGVEVLETSAGDTSLIDNGMMKVSKTFTLTSFDEQVYALSGLKVKVQGKDYEADKQALKVITLEVDTLHPNQFFPPKDVQDNPFSWSEWRRPFVWSLCLLLLVALVGYLYVRLRQNKPVIARIRIVKKLLPHQKAMRAIEQLKADRMPVSEDQKAYYTRLTDTLRQYIEERFGFSAMEMTSMEIIEKLREAGDQGMIDELRELFQTADLVKFAKHAALINENDMNLVNAIHFIDQTKQEDLPTEERIVSQLSDDDRKAQKSRTVAKTLLWGAVAAAVGILAYVVYLVSQLVY